MFEAKGIGISNLYKSFRFNPGIAADLSKDESGWLLENNKDSAHPTLQDTHQYNM